MKCFLVLHCFFFGYRIWSVLISVAEEKVFALEKVSKQSWQNLHDSCVNIFSPWQEWHFWFLENTFEFVVQTCIFSCRTRISVGSDLTLITFVFHWVWSKYIYADFILVRGKCSQMLFCVCYVWSVPKEIILPIQPKWLPQTAGTFGRGILLLPWQQTVMPKSTTVML